MEASGCFPGRPVGRVGGVKFDWVLWLILAAPVAGIGLIYLLTYLELA